MGTRPAPLSFRPQGGSPKPSASPCTLAPQPHCHSPFRQKCVPQHAVTENGKRLTIPYKWRDSLEMRLCTNCATEPPCISSRPPARSVKPTAPSLRRSKHHQSLHVVKLAWLEASSAVPSFLSNTASNASARLRKCLHKVRRASRAILWGVFYRSARHA